MILLKKQYLKDKTTKFRLDSRLIKLFEIILFLSKQFVIDCLHSNELPFGNVELVSRNMNLL